MIHNNGFDVLDAPAIRLREITVITILIFSSLLERIRRVELDFDMAFTLARLMLRCTDCTEVSEFG
jgi:hypothetical protein